MKIKTFCVGDQFMENMYVLYNEVTKNAVVIDPGMMNREEQQKVDSFIEANRLNIKSVFLTHCHIDHCCGASYMQNKYAVKVYAHKGDKFYSENLNMQASMFGLRVNVSLVVDEFFEDDCEVALDDCKISVLHVPGHSEGCVAYYVKEMSLAFCGDAIFNRSVGRTDLPGGSWEKLVESIHTKIFTLPGDTKLYCGHGPMTTVADETRFNPYL